MDEQLMEPPDVLSKKKKKKDLVPIFSQNTAVYGTLANHFLLLIHKVHRMTQRSTTFSDKISIAYQVSGVVVI